MPHQCTSCGTVYPDKAAEVLEGCRCSGKLFYYIKNNSDGNSESEAALTRQKKLKKWIAKKAKAAKPSKQTDSADIPENADCISDDDDSSESEEDSELIFFEKGKYNIDLEAAFQANNNSGNNTSNSNKKGSKKNIL